MNTAFQCTISYPLSKTKSACRINGQRITVTVAIDEGYNGSRIAIGEKIELSFALIQNPGSTKPTEPYEVGIKTNYYQVVAS